MDAGPLLQHLPEDHVGSVVVEGLVAKRFNLLYFVLQVDAISIKGTYPENKNEKQIFFFLKFSVEPPIKLFLKCPEKNSGQVIFF